MSTPEKMGREVSPGGQSSKVVLVSPFYAPENISTGRYNAFLGKALRERGCDLSVICAYPVYPEWRPNPVQYHEPGVTIVRGGAGLRFPRSAIIRRIILETWFLLFARRKGQGLIDLSSHVIAVVPPVGFIPFLPRARRLTVIVHDLQGIMATSSSGIIRKLVARIMKGVEKRILSKADRIVALSKSMEEVLREDYGLRDSTIGVFYPFATIDRNSTKGTLLKDVMPDGETHIVYSGALGEKQRPTELCKILDRIARETGATAHLFSAGPAFEEMRDLASDREWRIEFHPLVPDEALVELYQRSALQIVPQASGTSAGAFPSKLPNLIMSGVPVLAICDAESEVANVLKEVDGGRAVHTWNSEEVVSTAKELLEKGRTKMAPDDKAARLFSVDALLDWINL